MHHPISRFAYLFKRYTENNCTSKERNEFFEILKQAKNDLELNQLINYAMQSAITDRELSQEKSNELFAAILHTVPGEQPARIPASGKSKIYFLRAAAAVIVLLFGIGIYYIVGKNTTQKITRDDHVQSQLVNDVSPGHNGAILTLSNGQQITLDSTGNGILASQGNTTIVKQQGKIVYDEQNTPGNQVLYNTMTTPRGRQYALVLADGTKVWLNASSSITYPTAFTGNERKVMISGEVYFEVTKNASKPFKVEVGKMEVTVLGTHFNINAYDDEPDTKTTLLEGAVFVAKENNNVSLKPGQEAVYNHEIRSFNVVAANGEAALAWKNGFFEFHTEGIESIMRQLSRWYDIEVIYQGDMLGKNFSGVISQNTNLSQVLKMLQLTGELHFRIEGKKVIVLPGNN